MATYKQINPDAFRADINPADRNSYAIQAGYSGWDDYQNNANKPAQGNPSMTNAQISGGGGISGGMGSGVGFTANQTPQLNLPQLYKSLTADSGISNIEAELSQKTQAYNDAVSKINDNPFLSEATRVGRIQKLTTDFNNSTANLKNDIATRKADVETQLGLQTKQFDINNTITQQNLAQFNNLLSSGALNNANANDIAMITQSTGLSSSMIQSAVEAMRSKNLQTTVQTYDDGTNQGYKIITIDPYGNIVNSKTEILGPSSKTTTSTGISSILGGISGQGSSSSWKIVTPSSKNISDGWNAISMNTSPSTISSSKSLLGTSWTYPSTGKNYTYTSTGFA